MHDLKSSPKALPYLVATFGGHSTTVKRDADYQAIISSLRQAFKALRDLKQQDIILSAKLPGYGGDLIRIAEATWTDTVDTIKHVEITLDSPIESTGGTAILLGGMDRPKPQHSTQSFGLAAASRSQGMAIPDFGISSTAPRLALSTQITSSRSHLALKDNQVYSPGYTFSAAVRRGSETLPLKNICPFDRIETLKMEIEFAYGPTELLQKLYLDGKPLDDHQLIAPAGITEDSVLDLELGTRRSLIYLIYSEALDEDARYINFKISVGRAWELVALAPGLDKQYKGFTQSTSYKVYVGEDNMLHGYESDDVIEYLFWDGFRGRSGYTLANESTSVGPVHSMEWLKTVTTVEPHNSVAVPMSSLKAYLEQTLDRAGCEVTLKCVDRLVAELEPQNCKHLAIRFLSSNDAASLVHFDAPTPQTKVTHIAILYKALDQAKVREWSASPATANDVKPNFLSEKVEAVKMEKGGSRPLRMCMISWLEVP
ncbi:ubiquitin family protein [Ceratobasidium sp. AG-Ba]|nr:ubiquitin family protein [Ceratobasidium sp. AG-Ba]